MLCGSKLIVYRRTFALQFPLAFIQFAIILHCIVATKARTYRAVAAAAAIAIATQAFIIITKYGRN